MLYYAPAANPSALTALQLPNIVTACLHHSLSPDSVSVLVSCSLAEDNKKLVLLQSVLKAEQEWGLMQSTKLTALFNSSQVVHLNSETACVVVK